MAKKTIKKEVSKKAVAKKKATKKADPNKELYYVELPNHEDVRITIIDSSKLILNLAKEYTNFKQLRHQKEVEINKMRKEFRYIRKTFGELKSKLPAVSIKTPKAKKGKNKEEQHEQPPEQPQIEPPTHHSSMHTKPSTPHKSSRESEELHKLESELTAIEDKLSNLG
tara:strand:- start:914 stop:1417 length:504 start_codon:yes stop_codon:yes gene_type:complete